MCAFQKSFTIAGTNYTASYIRIDRIDINQEVKEAFLRLNLYSDKENAGLENARPFSFGLIKFDNRQYDNYFSRAKLNEAAQSNKTLHSIAYYAIKDVVAEYKLNSSNYLALIQNDFGGIMAYDGVSDC
jgi:hypothetical protein